MGRPDTHSLSRAMLAGALAAAVLAVVAVAQDATPPPPPPDSQQTLQQPSESTSVRTVRLSDVEGKVSVYNGDAVAFDQAMPNMPLVEGMRLVTAATGRLEIQFEDGSVARVTPNSSLTLTQLRRNPDGSTITALQADTGLTYYELNGRGGQYSVSFGQVILAPDDSTIFRVNLDGNPAELAVMHGAVHVDDGQSVAFDVPTSHSALFNTQDPAQYSLTSSIAANTWDQWNSDRDQALAELEQDGTEARAGSGSPDDPAWNDLDYYGDWYDVPGYGMAWSPSGVSADWDPFGSGYWGYYSGIGYSWISSYSWGWWPYHCGAWNYFNNNGWMWFPGNCGWGSFGGGWYPYPTVWRVPPGYRIPTRPRKPVHGPVPIPVPRLIAVDRGTRPAAQFRSVGQAKPAPRVFDYEGEQIKPLEANIHPIQRGPMGESFSATEVRAHPEIFSSLGLDGSAARPVYQPSVRPYPGGASPGRPYPGYVPPSGYPAGNRIGNGPRPAAAPSRPAAAPAPAVHASPAPSGSSHPR
jgi:hypothetical protein